jgi:hypothetical protein
MSWWAGLVWLGLPADSGVVVAVVLPAETLRFGTCPYSSSWYPGRTMPLSALALLRSSGLHPLVVPVCVHVAAKARLALC